MYTTAQAAARLFLLYANNSEVQSEVHQQPCWVDALISIGRDIGMLDGMSSTVSYERLAAGITALAKLE